MVGQDFQPFSNEILMELILPNYVVPKISMSSRRHYSSDLGKTFRAQILICGDKM